MPPAEVSAAVEKLRLHAYALLHSVVSYETWRGVPTIYMYCLRDNAIDIGVQRMLVEKVACGAGVDIKTETLDSGHSPFYSMPGELVRVTPSATGYGDN
ncbi:hypothetical protein ASPCAL14461 [Aspergillus calidoustus]|uniref:Uncharacterized protein n=1 Tax=Aspergillus calidoustus TaxID=454130 RepID=A0A0U5GKL7_ASPCI|nr:hypothetical protein ASPCAL14461 [Aspergillus calidoustus]